MTRAHAAYRRTGADLPWGDPLAPHGVAMEGWFWRVTDAVHGHVAIVLCGVCRGDAGEWTLVALATEPGGFVRSAICAAAEVSADGRSVTVPGGVLAADGETVKVDLGADARLDVRLSEPVAWPARATGGLGLGHLVPGIGQYWHPHLLGARVDGTLRAGERDWDFDGAHGYAEKNWGGGFPTRWWWGQASGIGDRADACVAFAGGSIGVGRLGWSPSAVVVRLGDDVLRMVPPFAAVATDLRDASWRLTCRSARHTIVVEGDGNGNDPHTLPVPVPGGRRLIDGAAQHFTGRLSVRVERGRRLVFAGESELAALERGDLTGDSGSAQD